MRRNPQSLWRFVPGFLAVGLPGCDVLTVRGPAADLWYLLREDTTVETLTEALADRYGAAVLDVLQDVAPLLERLELEGHVIV